MIPAPAMTSLPGGSGALRSALMVVILVQACDAQAWPWPSWQYLWSQQADIVATPLGCRPDKPCSDGGQCCLINWHGKCFYDVDEDGDTCLSTAAMTGRCMTDSMCGRHTACVNVEHSNTWGNCNCTSGSKVAPDNQDCDLCPIGEYQPSDYQTTCVTCPVRTSTAMTGSTDISQCLDAIDGNWGVWTPISDCSASCGGGVYSRTRACDSPAPLYGGDDCVGDATGQAACNTGDCPEERCGTFSSDGFTWKELTDTSVCIRTSQESVPWNEAKLACESYQEGRLFITDTLEKTSINMAGKVWVGLNDIDTEMVWIWSDGREMTEAENSELWNTNEPSTFGTQDCVMIKRTTGKLHDDDCNTNKRYVCEIVYCVTPPCPVNGHWGVWGAYSECSASCDGGRYSRTRVCDSPAPANGGDGCVGNATEEDDCNTETCAEAFCNSLDNGGFTWNNLANTSVCISTDGKAAIYEDAKQACEAYSGGRLFVSDTIEKMNIQFGIGRVWIGLTDSAEEDTWVWADGSVMTQEEREELWNTGEPNNHGDEDCAMIQSNTRKLHDTKCSNTYRSACEAVYCDNCPVNGRWGVWGAYSECSASCDGGTNSRTRVCDSPAPANGGLVCEGDATEENDCKTESCNVEKCTSMASHGFALQNLASSTVCIMTSSSNFQYSSAVVECENIAGARLFVSDTIEKMSLKFGAGRVWIGLTDSVEEDTWVWADSSVMTQEEREELWNTGEPNNFSDEDCAMIQSSTRKLHDTKCINAYKYVCEIPL